MQSSDIASVTSSPRDRTQHTPLCRQDAHQCSLRLVVHVKRHINIATKHSCLSFQAENHLSIQTFGLNHDFVLSFYRFFISVFRFLASRFLVFFFRVTYFVFSRSPPVKPSLCIAMEPVVFRDRKNETKSKTKTKSKSEKVHRGACT